jgi:hypothetical protein
MTLRNLSALQLTTALLNHCLIRSAVPWWLLEHGPPSNKLESPAICLCASISELGRSIRAVALEKVSRLHLLNRPFCCLWASDWSSRAEIEPRAVWLFQGWPSLVISLTGIESNLDVRSRNELFSEVYSCLWMNRHFLRVSRSFESENSDLWLDSDCKFRNWQSWSCRIFRISAISAIFGR